MNWLLYLLILGLIFMGWMLVDLADKVSSPEPPEDRDQAIDVGKRLANPPIAGGRR